MSNQGHNNQGKKSWKEIQHQLFRMVSIGTISDRISRSYDIIGSSLLILNLTVSFMLTFDGLRADYGGILSFIEAATVAFFAIDYVLRILTAECLYPQCRTGKAIWRFVISWAGIIDLLSFLPYYLPVFFPSGAAVFRMFRVARIFRLFRINAYYDSLGVITSVLNDKKQQLLSSVFIIVVLMLGSSLCMYSVEHQAQPDVFENAFSGLWWASSTLLTVGYGDIYPITPIGQFLGMLITFLGVGIVAIPTGIISAGFVEHYQRVKRLGDIGGEANIHFIDFKLKARDTWVGKRVRECGVPHGLFISVIIRGSETIMPRGDQLLEAGDRIIMATESTRAERGIELKEVALKKEHPWTGELMKDIELPKKSIVVLIKRKGKALIPRGDVALCEGDRILIYSKK